VPTIASQADRALTDNSIRPGVLLPTVTETYVDVTHTVLADELSERLFAMGFGDTSFRHLLPGSQSLLWDSTQRVVRHYYQDKEN
jgi:hypothetical protein